jgi:hypothetical protein
MTLKVGTLLKNVHRRHIGGPNLLAKKVANMGPFPRLRRRKCTVTQAGRGYEKEATRQEK